MKSLKKSLLAVKKATGIIIWQGEEGFACELARQSGGSQYALQAIISWGKGWDHVSVHAQMKGEDFTPFWEDMCYIKSLFFKPSETVIQYHPPSSVHVNIHKNTLHLWRQQSKEVELPPIWMV